MNQRFFYFVAIWIAMMLLTFGAMAVGYPKAGEWIGAAANVLGTALFFAWWEGPPKDDNGAA